MPTRRKLLETLSFGGMALLAPQRAPSGETASPGNECLIQKRTLSDGWEFQMDSAPAAGSGEIPQDGADWEPVQVPHTWETLGRSAERSGVAWYRLELQVPSGWVDSHVRIEFEAVNHTAHVFMNGQPVGEHIGKGYTAFTIELSRHLKHGEKNSLLIRVDNRPGDRMLPRNQSYDWTDDGGIIRPVNLLLTPRVFIERVEIDAAPDLHSGFAEIRLGAIVRNAATEAAQVEIRALIHRSQSAGESMSFDSAKTSIEGNGTKRIDLGPLILRNPALWHFDAPHLYEASIELKSRSGSHQVREQFGIRKFETRGAEFFLNGERVSLIGVERMAGSHPELGMAETQEWIDSNHKDLKNLNCVFTRVHWPQDRRVLEFCDRNGIVMQEEIPAWGPETFSKTTDEVQRALEQNGLEQLREMIFHDRNHPCIVSWGLCNEVDGKNPRSQQFAHAVAAEARRLDPTRLLTYASNSLDHEPAKDMAGDFDFVSANEYYGSWAPGGPEEVEAYLDGIRRAFPGKPIVVSEYGWCECQPKIMPGDENRVEIINSHTEVFRRFPEIAGAIYFDYNDYRTLVGDHGAGAMRQRVHGVVDLYGGKKPSFEALRLQASPIERAVLAKVAGDRYRLNIQTRKRLPGYSLSGYQLRWVAYGYDDLPMDGNRMVLPGLAPGAAQAFELTLPPGPFTRIAVDILRPTGFSVITVEYLEQASRK